jgi:catechol 2,3-dioxygenase-like lactoylglutathione lyase family enzyme
MVFDHIGFNVKNFAKSKTFYLNALKPLGIGLLLEDDRSAMIGRQGEGGFWFGAYGTPATPVHVAFAATSREQVREFHQAALAAGGKDNGGPGLRPDYHANYYAAFVHDPDGHNLEAVCHAPE